MGASVSPGSDRSRIRLDEILRFPLRPWLRSLIVIGALVVAMVSLLLPALSPMFAGLLSLVTMITLWVLALRVAIRLLIATAEGAGLEREYRSVDLAEFQALRQIGLWLFTALFIAAMSQSFGRPGFVLGLLPAMALLPGMTLLLAIHNQYLAFWQLERWRDLLHRLGGSTYRALVLLLVAFVVFYGVIDWLAASLLPGFLSNGLMVALWIYLLWAGFYALGRSMRRTAAHGQQAAVPTAMADSRAVQLKRLIDRGGSIDDHRRLFRSMEQNGDRQGLLDLGPAFIAALLLACDRQHEAVEKASALIALDPDFTLGVPSSQLRLIEAAQQHGHPELVADLAASYLSAWPVAPGGQEARLMACEAWAARPDARALQWFKELSVVALPAALASRYQALLGAYRPHCRT